MGVPKYNVNKSFFTDSEEYWYFIGLVASDGYINDNRIEICLNSKDRHILEQIRDLIIPNKPIYSKPQTDSYNFTIDSKVIALRTKSIFGMKTNKKHEEIRMPDIPSMHLKDFVRGLIDGDGCIDTTKAYKGDKIYIGPRLRILGSYDFLVGLIECIRAQVPNKTYSVCRKGKENVYYITYNFSIAKNILDWCYGENNICLKRKMEKYKTLVS